MTNADLAERAREIARQVTSDALARRRALLVAAVCLDESTTIDKAREHCASLTDDPALATAAAAVLDELLQLEGSQP